MMRRGPRHGSRPRADGGRVEGRSHEPRDAWSPQEREEAGRVLTHSLWQELSLAGTVVQTLTMRG